MCNQYISSTMTRRRRVWLEKATAGHGESDGRARSIARNAGHVANPFVAPVYSVNSDFNCSILNGTLICIVAVRITLSEEEFRRTFQLELMAQSPRLV